MKPRRADWWIVPIVGLLAVVALVLFNHLVSAPTEAKIVEGTAVSVGEGLTEVEITWSFPSTPDEVETATVRIPESEVESGTVLVWRADEAFTLSDPGRALTVGDYLVVFGLGALLGVVMVMTVRGYGYVRGTGETSSTPDLDVAEDRGFYWRT